MEMETNSEMEIFLTPCESNCTFCGNKLSIGEGILLQDCLHAFCRDCLTTWIKNSDNVNLINCPENPNCAGKILEREIKTLIPPLEFDEIQKRSLEKVFADSPYGFQCKSPNCGYRCFITEDSKNFVCPLCNQSNCLSCSAIHTGLSCQDYQSEFSKAVAAGFTNPQEQVRKIIEEQKKTNGFEQLVACSNSNASVSLEYQKLVEGGVIYNMQEFECSICFTGIPARQGIILQECLHMYCSDCITSHISHSDDCKVKCPNPECKLELLPREIEALLRNASDPNIRDKVNKKGWTEAEVSIQNKFHCLSSDCPGFCELTDDVTTYVCTICNHKNCVSCNAIHEKQSCEDYKNSIQQNVNDELSAKAVENLINMGKCMRCTSCKTPIEKTQGCDWVVCTLCKTELCFATKQARWGPKGKGDISGGCRCRVNNVLCAPNCHNCH